MDKQMKKGVLDLCVLSVLSEEDCYGYQLVEKISDAIKISEGTIYPLLKRLLKEGLLTSYIKESTEGPARKYYRLTPEGVAKCKKLRKDWFEFYNGVNKLLGRGNENEQC
ncbi:PadR family transcriptional regulator [Kosmotoga arenicorallina S304]|uniref:PadR family transcriptional regulator n=1 Tax=Kosmotoga arenicorallina S304 TaxID=1453497 RepID=A0A176JZG0_9BACT|nr:PadR family transcriptional regulator [Kosmotoga arenicorallina]OAA29468.1 PadR family transcriptional regulator [Kosmotoga arenicorallina S304]